MNWWIALLVALVLGLCGCASKPDDQVAVVPRAKGPRVRTLFLPWREYHPLADNGMMILKEGRFTERIPLEKLSMEVVNSGTAEVQDDELVLSRQDMVAEAKGNSELAVAIEHAERAHLAQKSRFKVYWQTNNLVYLEGPDYTFALSRKGEKPDLSRIKFKRQPKTGWMAAQQEYSGAH